MQQDFGVSHLAAERVLVSFVDNGGREIQRGYLLPQAGTALGAIVQQPTPVPLDRRRAASPSRGRAATVPRHRHACVSLTTKLGLTANIAATVCTRRGRAVSRINVRARMAS
jgi:hypothetical protein